MKVLQESLEEFSKNILKESFKKSASLEEVLESMLEFFNVNVKKYGKVHEGILGKSSAGIFGGIL